jgi:hypothetical protein
MAQGKINVAGIDRMELLKALWNNASYTQKYQVAPKIPRPVFDDNHVGDYCGMDGYVGTMFGKGIYASVFANEDEIHYYEDYDKVNGAGAFAKVVEELKKKNELISKTSHIKGTIIIHIKKQNNALRTALFDLPLTHEVVDERFNLKENNWVLVDDSEKIIRLENLVQDKSYWLVELYPSSPTVEEKPSTEGNTTEALPTEEKPTEAPSTLKSVLASITYEPGGYYNYINYIELPTERKTVDDWIQPRRSEESKGKEWELRDEKGTPVKIEDMIVHGKYIVHFIDPLPKPYQFVLDEVKRGKNAVVNVNGDYYTITEIGLLPERDEVTWSVALEEKNEKGYVMHASSFKSHQNKVPLIDLIKDVMKSKSQ